MKRAGKPVLAVVVAAQLGSSVYAWRDLARRPTSDVRGPKNLWRVILTLNTGNSVLYWLFGRR
jgi:hypothetical protein